MAHTYTCVVHVCVCVCVGHVCICICEERLTAGPSEFRRFVVKFELQARRPDMPTTPCCMLYMCTYVCMCTYVYMCVCMCICVDGWRMHGE